MHTYDVCDLVTDYADIFCQLFPPGGCVCPIPQGTYASDSLPFELPDFGDIFATLLQGSYTGKMTFHTLADPNTIYGCLDLTFEIVKA
ncbi:unnamed protein product [Darwinula stevensoni]|uniref:MD-2-related lipid-recognition domain-containing protein n=1 Tax=Darwinula stevensoni TaxID=69355 RepID=A0A7R9A8G2_9CRUS|nr:unnamed protein product [Darwinula stevensoni]CAG0896312.1 unnamed protein product [Darwinula stevensoni]